MYAIRSYYEAEAVVEVLLVLTDVLALRLARLGGVVDVAVVVDLGRPEDLVGDDPAVGGGAVEVAAVEVVGRPVRVAMAGGAVEGRRGGPGRGRVGRQRTGAVGVAGGRVV